MHSLAHELRKHTHTILQLASMHERHAVIHVWKGTGIIEKPIIYNFGFMDHFWEERNVIETSNGENLGKKPLHLESKHSKLGEIQKHPFFAE